MRDVAQAHRGASQRAGGGALALMQCTTARHGNLGHSMVIRRSRRCLGAAILPVALWQSRSSSAAAWRLLLDTRKHAAPSTQHAATKQRVIERTAKKEKNDPHHRHCPALSCPALPYPALPCLALRSLLCPVGTPHSYNNDNTRTAVERKCRYILTYIHTHVQCNLAA